MDQAVIQWVQELSSITQNFVITGHSLGGALGIIAAKELAGQQICHIEAVLTFGAPRVGSAKFVDDYNKTVVGTKIGNVDTQSLGDITYQTRIADDIVPKVPPRFLKFEHCGKKSPPLWNYRPKSDYNIDILVELPPPQQATLSCYKTEESAFARMVEVLDTFIRAWNVLFPVHQSFFNAADRVRHGGMSHRMIGYQRIFKQFLSFNLAINRNDSVLESIQDGHFADEDQLTIPKDTLSGTRLFKQEFSQEFHVEKVKGWTPLLTVVLVTVVLLLALFVFIAVHFVNPEYKLFAKLMLGAGAVSFVLKVYKEINGY